MSTQPQLDRLDQPSRRSLPRYRVQAPLDVTVLRSGIPDTLPGRSVNLSEHGIAAMLAGEVALGETVGVELLLPWTPDPLRARALVRHHERLRCGLEFVGLSPAQRAAIRAWADRSKAEPESAMETKTSMLEIKPPQREPATQHTETASSAPSIPQTPAPERRGRLLPILLVAAVATVLLVVSWWSWNRSWRELESGLPGNRISSDQPQLHVAAEEMQRLLVHRVDPDYPLEARQANLQAVIVLDVVIGQDGAVTDVHALNGPEILARAASDSLRWWKFNPYRVNGHAVAVETTVAVEFKP